MNQDERVKQLRKIQRAVTLARQVGGKPAAGRAALMGGATMAAIELVAYGLRSASALSLPWWVPFVAFGVVYGFVLHRAPYKTYAIMIYDLLASYHPRNERAYRELQEEAKNGGLRLDALEFWLACEWAAVQPPDMPAEQLRFLNKKIGPYLVEKD